MTIYVLAKNAGLIQKDSYDLCLIWLCQMLAVWLIACVLKINTQLPYLWKSDNKKIDIFIWCLNVEPLQNMFAVFMHSDI